MGVGGRWEDMQKVFREELDQKHAEHIAFRREQQAWRSERAELDMAAMVCLIKHGSYSALCGKLPHRQKHRQIDRQSLSRQFICLVHLSRFCNFVEPSSFIVHSSGAVSVALCTNQCPLNNA